VVDEVKTVATSAEKVSGADRWATNDLINAKLTSPAGTFVVGYNAIPDALSVASFAAANNYAIVLANADGSVDSAKLKGTVYTIGGPTLVSDITGAPRLFGQDRFDTNVEVIKALTYSYDKVYVANGLTLVDALSASSLAAKTGAPIVLTDNATVKAASTVNAKLKSTSVVIALGGTGVVGDSVKGQIAYGNTTFEVESVSVVNANHLKVTFTQAVDENTATDTDNYDFAGVGDADDLTLDEAEAEGNIVTLTLAEGTVLTNDPDDDVDYSVVIEDVENTSGDVMVDYKQIIALYDDVAPTVESVEMDNRDTLKITFSEDVKNTGTIEVLDEDGDEVDTDDIEIDDDDANVINVTGLGDEDEGDYSVTIEDVKDLAGNKIADTEKDFTLDEDDSDPDVKSVKAISATTLKVTFDEAINAPFDVDVYNAAGDAVAYSAVPDDIEVVSGTSKEAFYVTVGDFDDGDSHKVTISDYKDFSGNKGDNYTRFVKFDNEIGAELESTKATIKSYGGDKYAVFTYDMDVVGDVNFADLDDAYYMDEDDDEVDVEIDGDDIYDADTVGHKLTQLDDDQVAIKLTPYDKGDYTVTFPDGFITANGAESDEVDVTFTVGTDNGDVRVVDVYMLDADGNKSDEGDTVVVEFSDEVQGNSALDTDNYELDGDNIFDSAKFTDSNKDTVKLTIGEDELDDDQSTDDVAFTVENIIDADGDDVEDFDSEDDMAVADGFSYNTLIFLETVGPQVEDAVITASDKIEITFSEAIANSIPGNNDIDEDDFKVTVDGEEVDIDNVEGIVGDDIDGYTVFELTLEDDLEEFDTVKAGTSADFDGEDADGNEGQAGKLIKAELE